MRELLPAHPGRYLLSLQAVPSETHLYQVCKLIVCKEQGRAWIAKCRLMNPAALTDSHVRCWF